MIPAALLLLALVDGALLGFRAAAGRLGLIDKRRYYRAAVARGALAGGLVGLGGVLLALCLTALRGPAAWSALLLAGDRALLVYLPFCALILVAIALWLVPSSDLRTVMTVAILGPGTLLRPMVLLGGLGCGLAASPRWEVALLGAYAALSMLPMERWLMRRCYPVDPALLKE